MNVLNECMLSMNEQTFGLMNELYNVCHFLVGTTSLMNNCKILMLLGSGPVGVDDLCLHTGGGDFLLHSSPLKSKPQGPNPSLEARIPFSRPKSHFQGSNLIVKAQILPMRPKFQP